MRGPPRSLRLVALCCAAVTSGYLWRAALEPVGRSPAAGEVASGPSAPTPTVTIPPQIVHPPAGASRPRVTVRTHPAVVAPQRQFAFVSTASAPTSASRPSRKPTPGQPLHAAGQANLAAPEQSDESAAGGDSAARDNSAAGDDSAAGCIRADLDSDASDTSTADGERLERRGPDAASRRIASGLGQGRRQPRSLRPAGSPLSRTPHTLANPGRPVHDRRARPCGRVSI